MTTVDWLFSTTIRNNKLIAIYRSDKSFKIKARVFELKEGTTADIFNSSKSFDICHTEKNVILEFLDTQNSLQENNKLWVIFKLWVYDTNPNLSPLVNFVGYIDLDDMSLKNDSSLIKFPTHENFPVRGYTIDILTNEFGSVLYLYGGERYSEKNNSYSISSCFYKYNFTTKIWTDMAYTINENLKPLSDYRSVVIKNRYLLMMLGKSRIFYDPEPDIYPVESPKYEYSSIYNLIMFDTFTNKWENINIKPYLFDTDTVSMEFKGFMPTVYKDKIYVLGGDNSKSRSNSLIMNQHLGILDLNSKIWIWAPIIGEDASSVVKANVIGNTLLFKDQIIILEGVLIESSYTPIYVYDIPSQRMRSKLRLQNFSNDTKPNYENIEVQNQSKILPNYAIVLICVSCTILLGVITYLLYCKIKNNSSSKNINTKSNGPIREVWSNPGMDTINDIILWDKTKGLSVKNNNLISLKSNRPDCTTSTAYESEMIEFDK